MLRHKESAEPRLAVAMIARDAEQIIAASLDSIREMADEIIVADTGSLDRTRHVALARATHVVTIPWIDDFSAARNACFDRIKGDWVLWLDAGETIDADTAAEIRRFVDQDADPKCVYLLRIKLPPAGDNGAGEQVCRVRLMPNNKDLRFTGRIRESLQPAIVKAGLSLEPLEFAIHRGAIEHDPAVKARKARRDLKLAELEIRDGGPSASALTAMGDAWTNLGEIEQAIDCFSRGLALAARGSTEMLEAYYGKLAAYDQQPAARDSQVATCVEALEIFPFDAQLLCAMASYMQNRGRIDLASRAYQSAVTHGQINLETWHLSSLREVAATCLSLSLELLGQDDDACRVLNEALAAGDESSRLRRRLIDLHIKHNRRREALEQAANLADDALPAAQLDSLRTAIRGACLAAAKDWSPARAYLQAAYDAGCRDIVCLRWLAVTLISCEQFAAAEPILRQWQAAAPANVEVQNYLSALSRQISASKTDSAERTPSPPAVEGSRRRIDGHSPPPIVPFPSRGGLTATPDATV
ncbi:MAG TPA: glycosyltransferase [Pirellulales bacterium]|nr:glycosyltransferase [Pirellulales bacterium]